jgi:hypothetical protein
MFTQAGISQEELKVLVVEGLWQVAPPGGVFINTQPQTERNGDQDGE